MNTGTMTHRLATLLVSIALTQGLCAQGTVDALSTDRAHRGFHLTVGLGPVYGHIHDRASGELAPDSSGTIELQYKGTGIGFDLRVGGAIKENLVLTFDIVSRAITSPMISYNGTDYTTTSDLSIGEVTYGAGITYFLMPSNISLGATLGAGAYTFNTTGQESASARSDFGFSGVARAGKTWWLGRSVNMGFGLSYSYTRAPNNDAGVEETLWGDRLMASILFMLH
jgi:hypothetical protein